MKKRIISLVLILVMAIGFMPTVTFAATSVFATDYVSYPSSDKIPEIKNTACIVSIKARNQEVGTKINIDWDGQTWEFTVGINAFATFDEAYSAADLAARGETPQVILSAGTYPELRIKSSVEVFGANWNDNPNVVNTEDPTKQWELNPKWEINPTICNDIVINSSAVGEITIVGMEIAHRFYDSFRPQSSTKTVLKLINTYLYQTDTSTEILTVPTGRTGIMSKVAMSFWNPNSHNTDASAVNNTDETYLINLRVGKLDMVTNDNRLIDERISPTFVIDGFCADYNNVNLLQFSWFKWAHYKTAKIVFKNSYITPFEGSGRAFRYDFCGYYIDKTPDLELGETAEVEISNNIFYNSYNSKGNSEIRIFGAEYSNVKFENNVVINTNGTKEEFVYFGNLPTGNLTYYASFKNNTFLGYDINITLGTKNTMIDMTGCHISKSYSSDYKNEQNYILPTGNVCYEYCYVDGARTIKTEESLNFPINSGSCGENLTWILTGTEVTILGKGKMYNYPEGAPWGKDITSVIIENGVTSIGGYAFNDCKSLTYVYYSGTRFDSQNLTIDSFNESLNNATWTYMTCPSDCVYDNSYDLNSHFVKCTVCGDTINVAPHEFDNGCDTTCDCGYTRTITHDYQPIFDTENHFDKCTVCGDTVNVTPHTGKKVTGQAATCTVDGWKDYYECAYGCGKLFADEDATTEITDLEAWKKADGKLDAGHVWGEWSLISEATCEFRAVEMRKCILDADCTAFETRAVGNIVDHKYENYVRTSDATCQSPAKLTGTCKWCKTATLTIDDPNGPKPHSAVKFEEQPATCTADGHKEYYQCINGCNQYYADAELTTIISDIEAWKNGDGKLTVDHSIKKIEAKAPTALEMGWIEHYQCESCHGYFKDADATLPIADINEWRENEGGIAKKKIYNETTGESYDSIDEALRGAKVGDTVKLTASVTADYVLVSSGVTLDLNGHKLTATHFVGFDESNVVDNNVTEDSGIYVDKKHLVVSENNPQLPIYDSQNGCFVFTDINLDYTYYADSSYYFGPETKALNTVEGARVNALLRENSENTGVSIIVHLEWETYDYYSIQDFIYKPNYVEQYFQEANNYGDYSQVYFYARFIGDVLEQAKSVTVTTTVKSDRGTIFQSESTTFSMQ